MVRALPLLAALVAVVAAPVAAFAKPGAGQKKHTVAAGESLWTIARGHGCDVDAVRRANRLKDNLLQPGQVLSIPKCSAPNGARVATKIQRAGGQGGVFHAVVAGDTLGSIAVRYATSIEDLQARNDIKGHIIYAGQRLEILPGSGGSARAIRGQSVGKPHRGKLVRGTLLGHHPAYYRRRIERAWGANHTVHHVKRVARLVRSKYPRVHRLAIGDLSAKRGGKITMHNSHQSGRDVDLGFYFKKRPRDYPEEFVVATPSNLHFGATWLLIETLANSRGSKTGAERIFMSYETQKIIYQLAVKNGISKKKLGWMFQYPSGIDTQTGLIRHEPGHDEHIHVRFKCPENDSGCY